VLFNSLHFLIFFPVVVLLYFAVPFRVRWALLLVASYYFYMAWRPEYALLLVVISLIDFVSGIKIHDGPPARRKLWLILSLASNLGILFTFKYYYFFSSSLDFVIHQTGLPFSVPVHKFLLPIGISFHVFQSLSYTIDVYMRRQEPERHLGRFALYVVFFPQLVAGPIERPGNLLPQFLQKHSFDYERVTSGLRLMAWGFFKKLVIADRVAPIVNAVYTDPTNYSGVPLILATYLFGVQIYCDFSGYSDIAISAAKVMGYDLMTNFRQPYLSSSISEFWRRWHISLSTWFRDYVYIPLGGNQVAKWRWYLNLMAVFLVSGLWHGANWTFVIWGALHGFYIAFGLMTAGIRSKIRTLSGIEHVPFLLQGIRMFVTVQLVMFAWIFFRANSLSDALHIVSNMFTGLQLRAGYGLNIGGVYEMVTLAMSLGILLVVDWLQAMGGLGDWFRQRPLVARWAVYYVALFGILIWGKFGSTEFIYFQF
jgi:D-alanyl-lipoteichoic acid acyltransferase DltB (MBOAT superfamily)